MDTDEAKGEGETEEKDDSQTKDPEPAELEGGHAFLILTREDSSMVCQCLFLFHAFLDTVESFLTDHRSRFTSKC